MTEIIPRFEFRTFAQALAPAGERIRNLSQGETVRNSQEVYLLRPKEWHRNIKIRGGSLELKELIEQREDLQRWKPAGRWQFPLSPGELMGSIFPGFQVADRRPETEAVSKRQLLEELVGNSSVLWRANVSKIRRIHTVDDCLAEIDDILVNGALIHSVAIESEEADAVAATRRKLGLADYENVSYPLAIARIMGLEPMPDADSYG